MCNSTYSNIENNKNIHIYPNPSSDYILVDGVDMLENINVFNTLGQKQEVSFENNKIEIRSLTNGVYVLEITSENQLYRKAFIKN
jgi:hypothetical protein